MSITADEARELMKNDDNYLKDLDELKRCGEISIKTAIKMKRRYTSTHLHANNQNLWEDITTYWKDLGYNITYKSNRVGQMIPSRMEW